MSKIWKTDQFRSVLLGLFCFLIITLIHHSKNLLAINSAESISFKNNTDKTRLSANISNLAPGNYYLSLGRPRAICDIFSDGELLYRETNNFKGQKTNLLVGAAIKKTILGPNKITIKCQAATSTWKNKFFHSPLIASYRTGMLINQVRFAIDVLAGPVLALFFVAFSVFNFLSMGKSRTFYSTLEIISSMAVLVYALSLSYFSRLFMTETTAMNFHVFSRILFSAATTILLVNHNNKYLKGILLFHGLLLLPFARINLINVANYYRLIYPFFALSTLFCIYLNFKNKQGNSYHYSVVSVVWFLAQLTWYTKYLDNFLSTYSFPTLLAFLLGSITLLKISSLKLKEKIIRLNHLISNEINCSTKNSEIQSILTNISSALLTSSPFNRVSIYIDSFTLGEHVNKGIVFKRIGSMGYRDDSDFSEKLIMGKGTNRFMDAVLQAQGIEPFSKSLGDKGGLALLPLGPGACINFSSLKNVTKKKIYEFHSLLSMLQPVLLPILDKIENSSLQRQETIENFRFSLGVGSHQRLFGSIFIDIDNYYELSENYGNHFTNFISQEYLPLCAKSVKNYCKAESLMGDELTLWVFKESYSGGESIYNVVSIAISLIKNFQENEGHLACQRYGLPDVTMKMGAAVDTGFINIDQFSVRISSHSASVAARLLSAAGSNEINVSKEIYDHGKENLIKVNQIQDLMVKKNSVSYVQVRVRREPQRKVS
jgi:hypothetical protein